MQKLLILEQRQERIVEFKRLLESEYELTFADSVNHAVELSKKNKYALFVSALFLPRTESASESVFDFCRATKADPQTKTTPFFFCCIKPSNMMQSMQDAMQTTARSIGAEQFSMVQTNDLSQLPGQVANAIKAGAKA